MDDLGVSWKIRFHPKRNMVFNSCKCPPIVDELSDFENELMFLVENIEFRNINNSFQKNLNDDIKRINTSKKLSLKQINLEISINWIKMIIRNTYVTI